MLEPTRGDNVLELVLSSQNVLVDNVRIHESLGNSDHNQIHFGIKVKSESENKKTTRETSTKVNVKILSKVDWNNILRNKTAIECWNIF